jgi:hypothetical protein
MEENTNPKIEDVVSIALSFPTPFNGGIPFRREELVLTKDSVSDTITPGVPNRESPVRVFSYPLNPPYLDEDDRLSDYPADFLALAQLILSYHPTATFPFHPRVTDIAYPRLSLTFADGASYEAHHVPLSLSGDEEIEKIMALFLKYRPSGTK